MSQHIMSVLLNTEGLEKAFGYLRILERPSLGSWKKCVSTRANNKNKCILHRK